MFSAQNAQRSLTAARAIHETAAREKRDLSDDERRSHDQHMAAARQYTSDAETETEMAKQVAKFSGHSTEFRSVVPESGRTPAPAAPRGERRASTRHTEQAVLVPSRAEYRAAQAEGTDPTGGFLVPTEQAPTVVERLAPESVVMAAAPRLFTMGSDEMRVPKVATGATVAMVLENQPIPESGITFDAALLVARKMAGLVRSSNEWLNDAVPDARNVVEQHLLREIAIELDDQFFNGNGTPPNLLGILNWPNVTKTAGTASLGDVAAAIGRVEAAHASPSAIFMSPANWSTLRVERDGGATGGYVLQPDASAATRPVVFGVPVFVTAAAGTSIVVADMRHVAVGVRDRWTVLFDEYRYSEFDQTAIRVTSRWAVAPLHEAAVQIITTGGVMAAGADKPATTTTPAPAVHVNGKK